MMEGGVLLLENRVFDLEYVDDVPLLNDSSQSIQHVSDHLVIKVFRYGRCFVL